MSVSGGSGDEPGRAPLLQWTVCPNCWQRFDPSDVLFVARHQDLIGDPIAGPDAYLRFLPSRFSPDGAALDPAGMPCHQLACPRCHIELSRALLELKPVYLSIVGAPASGKSYYLGTLTWELRRQLPAFGLAFNDADPELNLTLHEYEQMLFFNEHPDEPVAISKTETEGRQMYRSVNFDGQVQFLPRSFQFTLTPSDPRYRSRVVVLYDNAGEHFLPGQDVTRVPVTRHLAKSAAILFVFDPSQDPRFRDRCESDDPQLLHGLRVGQSTIGVVRQETVLAEAAARVRRYRGLSHNKKHDRPLVVILAKSDIWLEQMLQITLDREPLAGTNRSSPAAIDTARLTSVSDQCRAMLLELCPEFVSAAEAFCSDVTYVPVTALGRSPELMERDGERGYGIRPRDIRPKWVTAPILYALHRVVPEVLGEPPVAEKDRTALGGTQ